MNQKNTIVRTNLLEKQGYTPYCGSNNCRHNYPRTKWTGEQFKCPCGFITQFPKEFIESYIKKWNLAQENPR